MTDRDSTPCPVVMQSEMYPKRMFVRHNHKFRTLEHPKRWIIGCETVSSGHSNFPNLTNFLIGDTSERITENTWHENSIES